MPKPRLLYQEPEPGFWFLDYFQVSYTAIVALFNNKKVSQIPLQWLAMTVSGNYI
jgi:hypothetical protein